MEKKHGNIIPFSNYREKKQNQSIKKQKSDSSLFAFSEDHSNADEQAQMEEDSYQAKIYYMSNYLQTKTHPPLHEPSIFQDTEHSAFPLEPSQTVNDDSNILSFQEWIQKKEENKGLSPDSNKGEGESEKRGGFRTFSGGFSSLGKKKFSKKGNVIYVNFKQMPETSQKPWIVAKQVGKAMAFSAAVFAFLFVFQTMDGLKGGNNLAYSMKRSVKIGTNVLFPTDSNKLEMASMGRKIASANNRSSSSRASDRFNKRSIANIKRETPLSPSQLFRQRLKKQGGEGLLNGSSPLSSEYKGF